jgi:hypothetical protein
MVSQERPSSCSYVVKPEEAYFPSGDGAGFFDVITTPADCQWRVTAASASVGLTGATAGTGAGKVGYIVHFPQPATFVRSADIVVAGLTGANPPARHVVSTGP